jgi:hypothetical protein
MSVAADRFAYRATLRTALPVFFIVPLFILAQFPRISTTPVLADSFRFAGAFLGLWYLFILFRSRSGSRVLDFDLNIVKAHYVQGLVHTSIFIYWAMAWPFISGQALLIIAQIFFAYAFDILLSWSRGNKWRLGFGPFPIILSTNLFLCFKDDWFYLQFLMIAVGMMGKEFIRWQKNGRSAHIFNPSAFALFVFSIGLIATGTTGITWAYDIATQLGRPEHIYLQIFLVGLIVQYLFHVTLVTLAAAAALYVLNIVYTHMTGIYWFLDSSIPIAVFLGLHLLITDPATSPRTNLGRILFGALYGAGVFALYGLLEWWGLPRFYDKLLCVPFLNLMIQGLDRIAAVNPLARFSWFAWASRLKSNQLNLIYMSLWIVVFSWMYTTHFVGKEHPGRDTEFWKQACADHKHNACIDLRAIYRDNCSDGDASACIQLGTSVINGTLTAADPLQGLRSFARACDLGNSFGCFNLMKQLSPENHAKLQQACKNNNANSCYILGSVSLIGLSGTADRTAAFRYFQKSCDLNYATGCGVMADAYRYGVGTEKDLQRAAAGYEKACNRSFASSCVSLADMLAAGQGTAVIDARRAHALYHKACLLGLNTACSR